jgi:hypothetical protein
MINEYKAVSLRHPYNQENGGLLRRLLLANAPSRHYGKSMDTAMFMVLLEKENYIESRTFLIF